MNTLSRYAELYEYIARLGALDPHKHVKPSDIGLDGADKQKCYRDIKEVGLEGNVIDYLCWLSLKAIIKWWDAGLLKIEKKKFGDYLFSQDVLYSLMHLLLTHSAETINLNRIPVLAAQEIKKSKTGIHLCKRINNELFLDMVISSVFVYSRKLYETTDDGDEIPGIDHATKIYFESQGYISGLLSTHFKDHQDEIDRLFGRTK